MYVHDRAPYIMLDKFDAKKKYSYEQHVDFDLTLC